MGCVAPGAGDAPVCSPLPGEMGLGGYYGHYLGHYLSATAFLINGTGDEAPVINAADQLLMLPEVATFLALPDSFVEPGGLDAAMVRCAVLSNGFVLSTLRPPEPHWAWLLLEALFVAVYSFDVVLKAACLDRRCMRHTAHASERNAGENCTVPGGTRHCSQKSNRAVHTPLCAFHWQRL